MRMRKRESESAIQGKIFGKCWRIITSY